MRTVLVLLLLATSAPAFADDTSAPSAPITQGNDPKDGMISTRIRPDEQPAPQPPSQGGAKTERPHGAG